MAQIIQSARKGQMKFLIALSKNVGMIPLCDFFAFKESSSFDLPWVEKIHTIKFKVIASGSIFLFDCYDTGVRIIFFNCHSPLNCGSYIQTVCYVSEMYIKALCNLSVLR